MNETTDETRNEAANPATACAPNSAALLIGFSFLGALCAGVCCMIGIEILAYPRETPPDYFLISPHQVVMAGALIIGFPVASLLSLITLRRVHLEHAIFVVGGVTFTVLGALPLLAILLGMVAHNSLVLVFPFLGMFMAMLYCQRRFPVLSTEDPATARKLGALPKSVRLVVGTGVLAIFVGYGGWLARPNHNALLVEAVLANDLEAARAELARGARLNYNPASSSAQYPPDPLREPKGPPLTAAILGGHREMFTFLAEQGAQLDLVSFSMDQTPLMSAAFVGDAEIVLYLLDHGVQEWHWGPDYPCAYEIALEDGHDEIAELLAPVHAEAARLEILTEGVPSLDSGVQDE